MTACKEKRISARDREKVRSKIQNTFISSFQVFKEVCANFSPVMKYFFLEKFPSAGAYYLARWKIRLTSGNTPHHQDGVHQVLCHQLHGGPRAGPGGSSH